MITVDLVGVALVGSRGHGAAIPREQGERWIAGRGPDWELRSIMSCSCCGEPSWDNGRCTKHQGRNPCAIEGCTRTRAAPMRDGNPSYGNDQSLCAEHWRRFVPPRSRARRLYHAHWRRAKKLGWSPARVRSFHRYWDRIIATARSRATGGHLDQAEIERMFGWDGGDS